MSEIQDPRIANIVYNFLGTTLAQLNEIDKHNIGGSSLKALKTNPKDVFRVNYDPGTNLIPHAPPQIAPQPPVQHAPPPSPPISNSVAAGWDQPQATAVAAPPEFIKNLNISDNNKNKISKEIDNIISSLSTLKNILNESFHN